MDFDSAEFSDFIRENTRFWRQHKLPRNELVDRYLVVDFYSCDPASIMLNAVLAKILQLEHGYKLIALTNADERARPYRMLAFSYGINIVYDVRDIASHMRPDPIDITGVVNDTLAHQDPALIRARLLALRFDGVAVGDLIYDSYLRDNRVPTIEGASEELVHSMIWGLRWYEFCQWLTDEFDVAGYVSSHNIYVAYGTMARVALSKGAFALVKRRRLPILFLRKFNALRELDLDIATLSAAELDFLEAHLDGEAALRGRKAVDLRFSGGEAPDATSTLAYDSDRRLYSRAELVAPAGRDPQRPIVFLMCQCFPEAHGNTAIDYLFDDHVDWLRETCRIAKTVPDVTWVIKLHPEHEMYTPGLDVAELVREHTGAGNILMCPSDLHNGNLDTLADAVVGIGDITFELTWRGVPCIVPSRNALVPHGWCHAASSRPEYEALLRAAGTLPRLPEEVVERSLVYANYFLDNRIDTGLIPTYRQWHEGISEEDLYGRAAVLLRSADLHSDPLYRNFLYMMRGGHEHLFAFDRLGLI